MTFITNADKQTDIYSNIIQFLAQLAEKVDSMIVNQYEGMIATD